MSVQSWRGLTAVMLGLCALGLASCASPAAAPLSSPSPSVQRPKDLLTTRGAVTVVDKGDGAELCLSGVLDSLPPQCTGPVLVGWDWSELEGDFDEASGVRWGDFLVTGTYDATSGTITPYEVTRGRDVDPPTGTFRGFDTPCPEPAGGWKNADAAMSGSASMDAAFALAETLDGYASSWIEPSTGIVNVRVDADPALAEAALREVWGGKLCVTRADWTAAGLASVRDEIRSQADGKYYGVNSNLLEGRVDVDVLHDDGTLQARYDAEYGAGVVQVNSSLVPAE